MAQNLKKVFNQLFLNEIIDSEKITKIITNADDRTEMVFDTINIGANEINTLYIESQTGALSLKVQYGIYYPTVGKIKYFKTKQLSPFQLKELLYNINLTLIPCAILEKSCSIYLPPSYKSVPFGASNADFLYLKQKIAYILENLIIKESCNLFNLNLIGFLSLDITQILLELRRQYPFIALHFIENTNETYAQKSNFTQLHNYLLAQADSSTCASHVREKEASKYIKHYNIPDYYHYAILHSDCALIYPNTSVLNSVFQYLTNHNYDIVTLELSDFKK